MMKEKAQEWIDRVKDGRLRKRDIWFLVEVQFWPRVGYGISYNTAFHAKLEQAVSKQYYHRIPIGGVVWSAPMAIPQLHGGFYGIGFPHPGIKCQTSKVSKLVMNYGRQMNVGLKMAVSFWEPILKLGITLPSFQEPYEQYKGWVTWSQIVSLWEKCSIYGVFIEITDTNLSFPKEWDSWIMPCL